MDVAVFARRADSVDVRAGRHRHEAGVQAALADRPHPVGVLLFLVILANSVRWRLRGYQEWKGRSYPSGGSARE